MKKLAVLFLTVFLVIAMGLSVFAAPSYWAKPEIDQARNYGLIVNGADQNYQDYITRRLFCELIIRMVELQLGSPVKISGSNPFADTTNPSIVKAYQLGIVKGVSKDRFAPNRLINRQEVAVIMMRTLRLLDAINGTGFAQSINISGVTFYDLTAIADWAMQDIKEAFALGIIRGIDGNKIAPLANISIEESILLTLRLYNRYQTL